MWIHCSLWWIKKSGWHASLKFFFFSLRFSMECRRILQLFFNQFIKWHNNFFLKMLYVNNVEKTTIIILLSRANTDFGSIPITLELLCQLLKFLGFRTNFLACLIVFLHTTVSQTFNKASVERPAKTQRCWCCIIILISIFHTYNLILPTYNISNLKAMKHYHETL